MVNKSKIISDNSPNESISEPAIMFPIAAPGFTPIPVPMPKKDIAVNTKNTEVQKIKIK